MGIFAVFVMPLLIGFGLIFVIARFSPNVPRVAALRAGQRTDERPEITPDEFLGYFANGFAVRPSDESEVIAWSTHEGDRFPAAVRRERTIGVQFHPEKSSAPGVRFLRATLAELTS